jgi:hypothetical protein
MATSARKTAEVNNEIFADELKPGTQLLHGQFTIESFLNSGGFGITYLARDSLDRQVVIKECFPGSFCRRSKTIVGARSRAHQVEFRSIVKLFVQEAFNLSKMKHPNIVGVHQVFEDNDTAYMAMDYIQGFDLLQTLEEGATRLSPEEISGVLQKILGAVGFVHSQGVLHRDISPDNILMDKTTGSPVLIDFGAAREEVSKASRALSAMRVVKDGYSPQEFYINGSQQGPASDLYALAATFYHLITGKTPPNSQTRLSAVASREPDPYVPLSGTVTGYPPAFLKAIDKAMNVFPKDRIQSADAWLAMIAAGAEEPVEPVAAARASSRRVVSEKVAVASAAAARSPKTTLIASVAALAILAGFAAWQGGYFDGPAKPGAAGPAEAAAGKVPSDLESSAVTPDAGSTGAATETAVAATEPSVPVTEPDSSTASDALANDPAPAEVPPALPADTAALPAESETASQPEDTPTADVPAVEVTATETVTTNAAPVASETAEADPVATEAETASAAPVVEETAVAETAVPATPPEAATVEAETAEAVEPTTAPVAEDAAAAESGEEAVVASDRLVLTRVVGMPFTMDEKQKNLIAGVQSGAPVWMQPGQRIVEANGLPVRSGDDLRDVMGSSADISSVSEVQVIFGVLAFEGADIIRKTEILPVVERLTLDNGLVFEVRPSSDGPQTVVSEVPAETDTDLQVGDVVVAYSATEERIDTATPLFAILSREIESKVATYSFVVQRGAENTVASFALTFAN